MPDVFDFYINVLKYFEFFPRNFTTIRADNVGKREDVVKISPDILLTNYMMMELLLTRYLDYNRAVISNCVGLAYLFLDELHIYRDRKGVDVALLIRRIKQKLETQTLICIGISVTIASSSDDGEGDERQVVADFTGNLFGEAIPVSNSTLLMLWGLITLQRISVSSRRRK